MGKVLGSQVPPSAAVEAGWAEALRAALSVLALAVPEDAPSKLARYHALLTDWNTRMNLTGDTDFATSLDRHYTDSLAPLRYAHLFPEGASLIDVGSGAGFPGVPLAIARPDLQITLLDSLQKRVQFLTAVAEELKLANVRVIHARAEEGGQNPALRERFDIAAARAVAPLPVLCELLLPFVRVGGRMLCYKGPAGEEELDGGTKAARLLGADVPEVLPVVLPSQPEWHHCLIVSRKSGPTPKRYPRKPGTPGREPLGSPKTAK